MALHSKKDFATACGLTTGNLTNYIKRGKVLMSGDWVDDTVPDNKDFLDKRRAAMIQEISKELKVDLPVPNVKPVQKVQPPAPDIDFKAVAPESMGGLSLSQMKTSLEIEKLKVDTRLQELKEEKIKGEVIPIVLVKQIFSAHSQSIITSQKDFIEELLINISKEAKLSGTQLAKLRGKMVKGLNEGVDKAIAITERSVKVLVDEFSIKKEVGERE